ncbi:MAG: hydroxymethylglutaryl-CoA reductase, degradative [Flavobacteriaceae bacterium]|nr:hydroxymethylglutaryl-CoA reductase, degradative [Flavobacteriaceae bacterium]
MSKTISGFSKLSKEEKIDWIAQTYFQNIPEAIKILKQYWNTDSKLQRLHDDFIENTVSNFYLPYALAPNFIINGTHYTIPMVVEESSVVAAASLVAKFWSGKGGFRAEVLSTTKVGHVHFIYKGDKQHLKNYFEGVKSDLLKATEPITENMRKRGGGILGINLKDKTDKLDNYYQLEVTFETKDSMGANFINSCLEAIANTFRQDDLEIVMSILSNYVPECLVRAEVSCPIRDFTGEDPEYYARRFYNAVQIANAEPYRAVTHNKGIMNGVDAVVIATGNDFRAVEAGVHAFASRSGQYKSLTNCSLDNGVFRFWIEIPLALGTVGGLTALHPLARFSLQLLQDPTAADLMKIVAVAGLAQNFAALRALTTTGIQQGHMKMHLINILNQLGANTTEKETIFKYFKDRHVTYNLVSEALEKLKTSRQL